MTPTAKSSEVRRALRWFDDYANHLEAAIPQFVDGGPSPEWQERARELDVTLRDIDVECLRDAAFSAEGKVSAASLKRAQEGFEAAITGRLTKLTDMISEARRGQRGLSGYARAGTLSHSSALYIERQF